MNVLFRWTSVTMVMAIVSILAPSDIVSSPIRKKLPRCLSHNSKQAIERLLKRDRLKKQNWFFKKHVHGRFIDAHGVCETEPRFSTNPIVGGKDADRFSFPWMVFLIPSMNDQFNTRCAGVLIHKQWILTAAHCLNDSDSGFVLAFMGFNDLNKFKNGVVGVGEGMFRDRYWIHPGYNTTSHENDLALIKLKHIPNDTNITPACIGQQLPDLPDKRRYCIAAGWGWINDQKMTWAQTLKQIRYKIERVEKYFVYVGKPEFVPSGLCHGDDGGPLMCPTTGPNPDYDIWLATGILTARPQKSACDLPGYSTAYTRIHPYINWIHEIMDKHWYY